MPSFSLLLSLAVGAAASRPLRIACVGDSITAGVCSSGDNHTYPAQLQKQLTAKYGKGAYKVTNLGSSGATMLKRGDQPYWQRGEFEQVNKTTVMRTQRDF